MRWSDNSRWEDHQDTETTADEDTMKSDGVQAFRAFRSGESETASAVRDRVSRIVAFRGYRISREDKEELVQEILVELWQASNKDGFSEDRGFWGFVQVVATRRCIDYLRRKKTFQLHNAETLRTSKSGPLHALLRNEKQSMMRRELARLDDGCRQLIVMRIQDELSYAEIADRDGRSEQALRAQMYRCVKKLRDQIAELGEQD